MCIAREPKQDPRKPHGGGMVARGGRHAAPTELGLGGRVSEPLSPSAGGDGEESRVLGRVRGGGLERKPLQPSGTSFGQPLADRGDASFYAWG